MSARLAHAWEGWLDLWRGDEDVRHLALMRILVGCILAWDLITTRRLGLIEPLWGLDGVVDIAARDSMPELWRWLGADAGWAGWALSLAGAIGLAAGAATRVSAIVLVLAYAQLADANTWSDRGIDTLLRNVTLVLACSPSHHAWSVDAWVARLRGAPLPRTGPAWPRRLLALQLVVVYAAAGLQKTALAWTPLGGFSALYIVLQDPSIASWRFAWLAGVLPLTQVATAATMAFEWGAMLVPVAWWFERTRTRPGWWRAQSNRTRWTRAWIALGVALHLGIAATMSLGIFPWAMLALYPALVPPSSFRTAPRAARRPEAPTP